MRKDVDRNVLQIEQQETRVSGLVTDRARVITGAWVANGLTCIFVGVSMWFASRTLAAEAELFKQSVVREVRAANTNKVP